MTLIDALPALKPRAWEKHRLALAEQLSAHYAALGIIEPSAKRRTKAVLLDGKRYESYSEAARETGIPESVIMRCCQGDQGWVRYCPPGKRATDANLRILHARYVEE